MALDPGGYEKRNESAPRHRVSAQPPRNCTWYREANTDVIRNGKASGCNGRWLAFYAVSRVIRFERLSTIVDRLIRFQIAIRFRLIPFHCVALAHSWKQWRNTRRSFNKTIQRTHLPLLHYIDFFHWDARDHCKNIEKQTTPGREDWSGVKSAKSWNYGVFRRKLIIQSITKNRSEGDICTV